MMKLIWGSGGSSLFDFYSLHHIVWFIAITTILTAIFRKQSWIAVLAVAAMWEIFEQWVVVNVPGFPFAGKEMWINKLIGDTISDILGFLIALLTIASIKKWWKYGQ
jgi:L-lactate permease